MTNTRDNGIVVGVVTDLNDPDRLGRVRVRLPHLDDQQSYWARMASPMAGDSRGFFFRPEPGDELLICFEMGDPRRPYVLGALWSSVDPPPPDDGDAEKNNWRFIKSRSGHLFKLDDTQGSEKIEIVDKDGSRKLIIDTSGQKIQIICEAGDVEVKASAGSVKVEATTVEIKATRSAKIEAGGELTLKGSIVNIN